MSYQNRPPIVFSLVFSLLFLAFSTLVIADEEVGPDGSISGSKESFYEYQLDTTVQKGQQITLYFDPMKFFLKLVVEKDDGTFVKETDVLVFENGDISATFISELAPGDYILKAKFRLCAKIGAAGIPSEYLYLPTIEEDFYNAIKEECGNDDGCYESKDTGEWYFISKGLSVSESSKYRIDIQAEAKDLEAKVIGDFELQKVFVDGKWQAIKEFPGIIDPPISLDLIANGEINKSDNVEFYAEYEAKIISNEFETTQLVPPEITILNPSDVITKKEDVTFSAKIVDQDGTVDPNSVYFFIDGKKIVPELVSEDIYEHVANTSIGSHMFRVSAKDNDGNISIDEKEFKINIYANDTTGPVRVETTPVTDKPGEFFPPVTAQTKPIVSITVFDESGIDTESISNASLRNISTDVDIPVQTEYSIKSIKSRKVTIRLIYDGVLTNGSYKAGVDVEDKAGNPGTFSWNFDVNDTLEDKSPPIIELIKPLGGARVKPDDNGKVEIELGIYDPSGVSYIAGGIFDPDGNILVSGGTKTSYLIDATTDGIYNIVVVAIDNSFNKNRAIERFNFIVDSKPPIARVHSPEDGEEVPTTTPGMAGYVEPNDVADKSAIEVYIDNNLTENFIYTHYGLVNIRPQKLENKSQHEVKIIATDQAGNISEIVQGVNLVFFTVDTDAEDITAPAVPLESVYPKPDSVISVTDLSQIEFIAADASGIDEVWIEVNGWLFQLSELSNNNIWQNRSHYIISLNRSLMILGEQQAIGQSGLGGFQFDPLELGALEKSFNSGQNNITLEVTDRAGNTTTQSWDFYVVTEPPQVPVLDEMPKYTNKKNLTVTGTVAKVSPDNPITVSIRVDGVVVRTAKVDENGNFTAKDVMLVIGDNQITAMSTDQAGNSSDISPSVEVIVDVTLPQITLDELPDTTDNLALTVSGCVIDNTEVASASLILNGESQSLSLDNNNCFRTEVELIDGLNQIQVQAQDVAGNVATSKVSVKAELHPWDVKKDDVIDIFDLVLVGKHFGESTQSGDAWDVKKDGIVDIFDLVLVGKHFGETYEGTSAAPAITSTTLSDVTMFAEKVDSGLKVTLQVSDHQFSTFRFQKQTELSGFQFDLGFDSTQLEFIDIKEGNALSSLGTETYCLEPKIETGSVGFASIALNPKQVLSTSKSQAVLAEMNFKVKGNLDDALKTIKVKDIKLSDSEGEMIPVGLDNVVNLLSNRSELRNALLPNYPNPFNPETWIPYSIAEDSTVTVRIYNLLGQAVRRLDLGWVKAGEYVSKDHAVYWDGKNKHGEHVASGIYYYQINVFDSDGNKFTATRKLVILK